MVDIKKFFINQDIIEVQISKVAEFYKLVILVNHSEKYDSLFEPQHLKSELYMLMTFGLSEEIIEFTYGELWK